MGPALPSSDPINNEKTQDNSLSTADLISIWNTTRRAVESLDATLIGIRKIYLTIVGLFITLMAGIYGLSSGSIFKLEPPQTTVATILLSIFVVSFTVIFWAMDTHYHGYLRAAAKTAERLEAELFLWSDEKESNKRLALTHELAEYRRQGRIIPRFFHLIYTIPAMGSAILVMASERHQSVSGTPPVFSMLLFSTVFISFTVFVFLSEWNLEFFIDGREIKGTGLRNVLKIIARFIVKKFPAYFISSFLLLSIFTFTFIFLQFDEEVYSSYVQGCLITFLLSVVLAVISYSEDTIILVWNDIKKIINGR